MIPTWIIDQLKRREEEERRRDEKRRERLELPLMPPTRPDPREEPERPREPGGPIVIDLWSDD